MNRRKWLKTSLGIGGGFLLPTGVISVVGCSSPSRPALVDVSGRIMGTGYSVLLGVGNSSTLPGDEHLNELSQLIHKELQAVDSNMSTWKEDSGVSRFNDSSDTDWQQMAPATIKVIARALNTSKESNGAFDITVGPLVNLWGFGSGSDRVLTKPKAIDIQHSLAVVGHEAIEVDLKLNALRKRLNQTQIDLSGIAKGYAVDRVASLLDQYGFDNYLIEVGGELKAKGSKPDNSQWRVAIERPVVRQRDPFRVVQLNNNAIATSGDYRNFFVDGGQRYSHSIDPRTGQPVTHELASVSVVAESAITADALSTALMIMGPELAMNYASKNQVAIHLVVKSGSKLKEHYSSEFESLLV